MYAVIFSCCGKYHITEINTANTLYSVCISRYCEIRAVAADKLHTHRSYIVIVKVRLIYRKQVFCSRRVTFRKRNISVYVHLKAVRAYIHQICVSRAVSVAYAYAAEIVGLHAVHISCRKHKIFKRNVRNALLNIQHYILSDTRQLKTVSGHCQYTGSCIILKAACLAADECLVFGIYYRACTAV